MGNRRSFSFGVLNKPHIRTLIDADTNSTSTIADVSAWPFQGPLPLSVSPDGVALEMATTGPIQLVRGAGPSEQQRRCWILQSWSRRSTRQALRSCQSLSRLTPPPAWAGSRSTCCSVSRSSNAGLLPSASATRSLPPRPREAGHPGPQKRLVESRTNAAEKMLRLDGILAASGSLPVEEYSENGAEKRHSPAYFGFVIISL